MQRRILLAAGAVLLAALALGIVLRLRQATAEGEGLKPVTTVQTTKARVADWPVRVVYPADVQAFQRTLLVPQDIRGHIKTMYVDKGDDVKAGQRLVDIDCPNQADARARADEDMRRAEAQLKDAQLLVDRLGPMAASKLVPQEQYDHSVLERDAASAEVGRLKASLAVSEDTLGFCHLDAPYAGTITARFLDPGNEVEPNTTPVLEMMDTSVVRVMVHIAEKDLPYVKKGLAVALRIPALGERSSFHGSVTRVVRSVDPSTRTELVEADIPNPDGTLKPGMYGELAITLAVHPHAVLVPDLAVIPQLHRTLVMVEKDGVVEQREVSIGDDDGSFAEILPDPDARHTVAAGEQVICAGKDLVADGSPVKPTLDDRIWRGFERALAGEDAAGREEN